MMGSSLIMPRVSLSPCILFNGSVAALAAAQNRDVAYATAKTSVGSVLVAVDSYQVVAVLIEEGSTANLTINQLLQKFPQAKPSIKRTRRFLLKVTEFVEAPKANLALSMDIRGTPFQLAVWREILKIPFGETTTFAEIARRIDAPKAVRAVGNACSHNPLEFAIPCHRVLRSDGSWSGGSAWGNFRQSTVVSREAEAIRFGQPSDTEPYKFKSNFAINGGRL
jgi:AraC family transcriptional regulator of adaptative response/methylated-DNA-[protein]-cysteine methyltransferase